MYGEIYHQNGPHKFGLPSTMDESLLRRGPLGSSTRGSAAVRWAAGCVVVVRNLVNANATREEGVSALASPRGKPLVSETCFILFILYYCQTEDFIFIHMLSSYPMKVAYTPNSAEGAP